MTNQPPAPEAEPAAIAPLVFVGEFFAPIFLFFGLFGRIAALAIAIDFTTVAFKAHIQNGFFMNWSGQQKGEGIELFFLMVFVAIALVISGSGALSIDRVLARRNGPPQAYG